MVFALNGGGETTKLGGVKRPVVPLSPDVVAPAETSGDRMPATAYSDRFKPYCLTRFRLTSRISMSNITSARALSFCAISRSMIWTIGAGALTVIVLAVLLN